MLTIQEKMHAEAAELSRRAAGVAATQQAQAQALRIELAEQHHADLLARYTALQAERHELGKELQEAQHQVLALSKAAQPDFQRGAELTFRAQWLQDQIAQKDRTLAQLDQELHTAVERAAAQRARQVKAEHNHLVQECEAKKVALLEQMRALQQEYAEPISKARQQLVALSMLTPVDLTPVAHRLLREQ
jgi:hypothetical protein